MRRFTTILLGMVVLTAGLLACGGDSEPAVPTLPPLDAGIQQQPTVSAGRPQSVAPQPAQSDQALDQAAQPPEMLRGEQAPPPPWPTFTPGPKPQSEHRLLFARARKLYTARADGADIQPLELSPKPPQLFGGSFKDPGRGWLGPKSRYLLYFADQEAQLWRADLTTAENVLLAERMIPLDQQDEAEFVRILVQQKMSWASDGTRVALVGVPDTVDLFIADLAAQRLTRVTRDELQEGRPYWSPNAQYLVYVTTDQTTGSRALYVWDAQAQQTTEVDLGPIRKALDLGPGAGFAFGADLMWVSDTELVFYPSTTSGGRSAGIWSYDASSGALRPIATEQMGNFDWSDEAGAWAYARADDESGALWMLELGAGDPKLLVEGQVHAPVWSPDGRSILYSQGDPEAAGWDLRVVDVNGNTRTLAEDAPLIQPDLSDPGPAGKRYWDPAGQSVLYTAVGRDYGRAEQEEGYGGEAGPDLENWWIVPAGGGETRRVTDMQKTFYLQDPELSPDGGAWAFIAFSYVDRMQHLYTMSRAGSHPERVDAGILWFEWLP